MFIARFQILGITIPIGVGVYHDDGFVASIQNHIQKLAKTYPNIRNISSEGVGGMCIEGEGILRTHLHVFYKDTEDEGYNIRRRAHEETHALDFFGRLDVLERRILSEQNVKINFPELRDAGIDNSIDGEVRAEIGAIYSLKKRGISLDNLKGCPEYFAIARAYYEERKDGISNFSKN
ncbi:MAG: hypothetical protein Q8R18_02000 [bacterium]|nr:hypothetical protein [bacterium]